MTWRRIGWAVLAAGLAYGAAYLAIELSVGRVLSVALRGGLTFGLERGRGPGPSAASAFLAFYAVMFVIDVLASGLALLALRARTPFQIAFLADVAAFVVQGAAGHAHLRASHLLGVTAELVVTVALVAWRGPHSPLVTRGCGRRVLSRERVQQQ